jgi:transcriptional regulator with XRE-family HTH domain
MERPGEKLRQVRERLRLTYRDVVQASQKIAQRRNSEEFALALSRLADIENKGTLPTVFRLYTLCAIYRLDWAEVLRWYGVPLALLPADAMQIPLDETHAIHFRAGAIHFTGGAINSGAEKESPVSPSFEPEIDLNKTTFLNKMPRGWGKMPLDFLAGQDQRQMHYGLVGLADWSMYPLLRPGSLLWVDQNRRKIAADGWTSEFDRPIYFLEHREGYRVGWCSRVGGRLLVQPHPAAQQPPTLFDFSDIDVVGQVTGVATVLETKRRRHARTSIVPAKSPNP